MSTTVAVLMIYVLITLVVVLIPVSYRGLVVATGKGGANMWTRGAKKWEDPAFILRAEHAHANCIENLLPFAVVLLAAFFTGQSHITEALAPVVLALRAAQVSFHLMGTSHWLVVARASAYLPQVVIVAYWAIMLIKAV